ncbi:tRNA-dihydrouridine synthase [Patescibacteria group bacterium]|nr:tRNA-dihydrouridine synthase [Patescibacteria group bacterium]MBU1754911.1 tRNA-dihydrouridine synthase [Patescibacteria group bacterium]
MNSFWNTLSKPFFVLAPMADVTDPAYRRLIAETHPADVMWTEFVSADGLYHTREKKGMKDDENPLMRDLLYTEGERPLVAQLFSSNPENMAYAAKLCAELGFDGIDINMGCPDKSIEKQGCGSAMIKTPEVAVAIIAAARTSGLPVSVKTRIGYNKEEIDTWIPVLLKQNLPALTVHMRTRKEMSKVPAHWDLMPRIVALRNELSPDTLIIGNGDVIDLSDARAKIEESGCDGAMLGRAIFGNPWVFAGRTHAELSKEERLKALDTLARYFEEIQPHKSFHLLKKHVKAFVQGFDGAAELRGAIMNTGSVQEMRTVLQSA